MKLLVPKGEEHPTAETYTIDLPSTSASFLEWLGMRHDMTPKEYIEKMVKEYLQSALTQLDDKEAADLLGLMEVGDDPMVTTVC
jgi:hypothetical protein